MKGKLPEMVVIQAGRFPMGSNDSLDDEKPVHEVTITHSFAIGRYPVTFEEYDAFCGAAGRDKPNDIGWGRGNRPVINVSWQDSVDYCVWLSQQTGENYRLPSEAEWEYACRAGSEGNYCFGDDLSELCAYAWHRGNSGGKTHPVGMKKHNAWGLYDMHGNVLEWCADRWHDSYQGAPTDGSAWESGMDESRLLRGGSWAKYPVLCRAAYRVSYSARYPDVGFRVVKDL